MSFRSSLRGIHGIEVTRNDRRGWRGGGGAKYYRGNLDLSFYVTLWKLADSSRQTVKLYLLSLSLYHSLFLALSFPLTFCYRNSFFFSAIYFWHSLPVTVVPSESMSMLKERRFKYFSAVTNQSRLSVWNILFARPWSGNLVSECLLLFRKFSLQI